MEGLMGWAYWTVRDLTCSEGWIVFLDALLEVHLPEAGSSEDMLWGSCNIIYPEGEGSMERDGGVGIVVTIATRR